LEYESYHIKEELMDVFIEEMNEKDEIPMKLLLEADPSEELINEYIHNGIKYIVKNNNEIIGIIVLVETRPKTIEIMNVSVKEEYQNKGIGKLLVLKAIERAKKEKMKTIEIGTGNNGVIQMLLYQKCGFRIIGIDFDFFRRYYKEKIIENGIECRDMIRMRIEI
jgi:ribosomal protein S18 acetylase RimI-like enzyme